MSLGLSSVPATIAVRRPKTQDPGSILFFYLAYSVLWYPNL
jgi:hypothetical protein